MLMVLKISGLIHKILNCHMDIVQNVKRSAKQPDRLPNSKQDNWEVEQASPAASFNE